jgi:small basic protein
VAGVIILIGFIIAGFFTGLNLVVPYVYSKYIAVAILACLDSVFGAFTANMDKKFRINIFLSGFFGNALIAMFLVFIGDKLNVDIYLAAVIVFSGRLLNNFSTIRREYIQKIDKKVKNKNKKQERLEEKKEDSAEEV